MSEELEKLGYELPKNLNWLWDRSILMVKSGSHAYGTFTPESDLDYRGVVVPPKEFYFGMGKFDEHYGTTGSKLLRNSANEVDVTAQSVEKFVKHCAEGIPNTLEVLFTRPEETIFINYFGEVLREHRHEFLTKGIYQRFKGYSFSQMKKIQTGENNGAKRPELIENFGYDTKFAMHSVRLLLQGIQILKESELDVWSPHREELIAVRNGAYSLDEVLKKIEELGVEFDKAHEDSKLPSKPNFNRINGWLIDLTQDALDTFEGKINYPRNPKEWVEVEMIKNDMSKKNAVEKLYEEVKEMREEVSKMSDVTAKGTNAAPEDKVLECAYCCKKLFLDEEVVSFVESAFGNTVHACWTCYDIL